MEEASFEFFGGDAENYAEMFKSAGFEVSKTLDSVPFHTIGDFKRLKVIGEPEANIPSHIRDLSELGEEELQRGIEQGISHIREYPEYILSLPLTWYEKELSCCARKEGELTGLLLIHRNPSGILDFMFFADWGTDAVVLGDLCHLAEEVSV